MSEYPIIPKEVNVFNKVYHSPTKKMDLTTQIKTNKYTVTELVSDLSTTNTNLITLGTNLGTTKDIVEGFKTSFSTGSLTLTNLNGTNANTLISQITSNKNTLASLIASLSTTDTNLSSLTTKVTSYIASLTTLSTSIDDTNTKVDLNDGKISVLDGFVLALKRFIDIMLVPINNIPFVDKIKTPW